MPQHQQQQEVDWSKILGTGPYPIEAYAFVQEGLRHTVQAFHEDVDAMSEDDRHISGQELCIGLRDVAIEKWGLLAPVVLDHWHIKRTNDFGRIVYAMIDAGLMTRTPNDSIDDFCGVYDFDEAFSRDVMLRRIKTSPTNN